VSFEVDAIPAETVTGLVPKNGVAQDAGGVADNMTCPEKPFRLATEIVEFAFLP
jgi:hypothetical protein